MHRRHFLASAALAAAGVASARPMRAPALAPTPIPARAPQLRKALKYAMIGPGSSVAEKFAVARECGFEGVEMDSPGGPPADEVLAAAKSTGLEVAGVVDSVHWGKTLGDPDPAVRAEGLNALLQAIRDCKAYGGGSVLLVPAVVNERISYADAYARSQEEVRKALPLAHELDILISFENVWNNFLLSPLEAARYVDEFESDHARFHFDVGNIVNYGWPEHWIRTLAHRISRLDIKEFSRAKRNDQGLWRGFDVEIGDGDCGWPAVMQALRDVGYSGWAAAEVGGGDHARLKDIASRMDRVFTL